MKKLIQLGGLVVLAFSIGVSLPAESGTVSAAKVKVLSTKKVSSGTYHPKSGYFYKTTSLSKKAYKAANHKKEYVYPSKKATIRKKNGKKAVYYYVSNKKGSIKGWIWHGNLSNAIYKSHTTYKYAPTAVKRTVHLTYDKHYKPNNAKIADYFVTYLNELHQLNGTMVVQHDSDLQSYADTRAKEASKVFEHNGSRDLSENLSSGTNTESYSDQENAYNLLMEWYDESFNVYKMGQEGHWGHRSALIYSGPNVALGLYDDTGAFEADWDYATLDQFNALYYSTSKQPDTVPLPDTTFEYLK